MTTLKEIYEERFNEEEYDQYVLSHLKEKCHGLKKSKRIEDMNLPLLEGKEAKEAAKREKEILEKYPLPSNW